MFANIQPLAEIPLMFAIQFNWIELCICTAMPHMDANTTFIWENGKWKSTHKVFTFELIFSILCICKSTSLNKMWLNVRGSHVHKAPHFISFRFYIFFPLLIWFFFLSLYFLNSFFFLLFCMLFFLFPTGNLF